MYEHIPTQISLISLLKNNSHISAKNYYQANQDSFKNSHQMNIYVLNSKIH